MITTQEPVTSYLHLRWHRPRLKIWWQRRKNQWRRTYIFGDGGHDVGVNDAGGGGHGVGGGADAGGEARSDVVGVDVEAARVGQPRDPHSHN